MQYIIISIIIGIISILTIITIFMIKEKKDKETNINIKKEEALKQIEINIEKKEESIDKVIELLKNLDIDINNDDIEKYYKNKNIKVDIFCHHNNLLNINKIIDNIIIEKEIDKKEIIEELDKLLVINNDLNGLIKYYNSNTNNQEEIFIIEEKETNEED